VSCGRLDFGLAAVIILFATAVLTNIKAKLIGEFTLSAFGPTEFKTLLTVYALVLAGCVAAGATGIVTAVTWAFGALITFGAIQLLYGLVRAVKDVDQNGRLADTTEWVTTRDAQSLRPRRAHDPVVEVRPSGNAECLSGMAHGGGGHAC